MAETLVLLAPWLVLVGLVIGLAVDVMIWEPRRWRLADEYALSVRASRELEGLAATAGIRDGVGPEPFRDAAE
jgi:hypothetical protein